MARASRIFLEAYAALFSVLAGVAFRVIADSSLLDNPWTSKEEWWRESGAMAVAYLVLAIGLLTAKGPKGQPSRIWLAVAAIPVISQLVPNLRELPEIGPGEEQISWQAFIAILLFGFLCVLFLATYLWLHRELDRAPNAIGLRWRRAVVMIALAAGAVLVGLSLFSVLISRSFFCCSPEHKGWEMIAGKTHWVNVMSVVKQTATSRWTWPWLETAENALGYLFYLGALLATLALVMWLGTRRLSTRHIQSSRALPIFAALFSFLLFGLSTEAFWTTQQATGHAGWTTVLTLLLWSGAPFYVMALLVSAARAGRAPERWRTLMYIQMPVVTFFYFVYLPLSLLEFAPGLLALFVGLQLESLGCIGLLTIPAAMDIVPKESPAAQAVAR